ncbi:MAG: Xaa-Pro peptidase family protein [Dysgonamonadaceae bacterium]|jgi:Xaa-Pro aminopeptidase|nr:Xaa-Pro peptidase family protein [Dysgonamonadaceae bacterium]
MQYEDKISIAKMPSDELKKRVVKVQQALADVQADACVVTTAVNQLYLAGFIFDGFMFVAPETEPILFVKRPIDTKGERVEIIRKPEQIGELLPKYGIEPPRHLLLENDVMSYNSSLRLQAALNMPKTGNASGILRKMRMVKSEYELSLVRESARLQNRVYAQVRSIFKPGMTDVGFQIEVEHLLRKTGSQGIFRCYGENMDIFMGSVLAGDNATVASPYDFALGGQGLSPVLPLGANGTPLTPGITLMVDMCGNFTPYQSDMTRSFAIGDVPEIAYRAHQLSIDIHGEIQNLAKAGTSCSELYGVAEKMTREAGLEAYFMGTVQQAKFIGHGVGLEINEPPVLTPKSKDLLSPGMVIAIEPKYVLQGIGAVGIENTYIVHESGLEKITLCEESLVKL